MLKESSMNESFPVFSFIQSTIISDVVQGFDPVIDGDRCKWSLKHFNWSDETGQNKRKKGHSQSCGTSLYTPPIIPLPAPDNETPATAFVKSLLIVCYYKRLHTSYGTFESWVIRLLKIHQSKQEVTAPQTVFLNVVM